MIEIIYWIMVLIVLIYVEWCIIAYTPLAGLIVKQHLSGLDEDIKNSRKDTAQKIKNKKRFVEKIKTLVQ
jgi:hypothetical protein